MIGLAEPLGVSVEHRLYWVFWVVHVVAFAAAFAWAAWQARTPRDALHGATWTYLVFLWTAPWTQAWYGTWILPLLAVEEDPVLRRVGVAYTFILVVQYALAFDRNDVRPNQRAPALDVVARARGQAHRSCRERAVLMPVGGGRAWAPPPPAVRRSPARGRASASASATAAAPARATPGWRRRDGSAVRELLLLGAAAWAPLHSAAAGACGEGPAAQHQDREESTQTHETSGASAARLH